MMDIDGDSAVPEDFLPFPEDLFETGLFTKLDRLHAIDPRVSLASQSALEAAIVLWMLLPIYTAIGRMRFLPRTIRLFCKLPFVILQLVYFVFRLGRLAEQRGGTDIAQAGTAGYPGLRDHCETLHQAARAAVWSGETFVLYLRNFAFESHVQATPHGLNIKMGGTSAARFIMGELGQDASSFLVVLNSKDLSRDILPSPSPMVIVAADDDWRRALEILIDRAAAIVVNHRSASESIRWELSEIINRGHEGKTIIIDHPVPRPADPLRPFGTILDGNSNDDVVKAAARLRDLLSESAGPG